MLRTLLIDVGKALYLFSGLMGLAAILTWMERKQSALMQDRVGANRARIFGLRLLGLPHIITDAVKLLTKEDFVPAGVPTWLHALAPWVTLTVACLPAAAIPFGHVLPCGGQAIELQLMDMQVGLVYALAIASMAIYGVILAGWVTRNKWAVLGSLRAAAQLIGFGVVLGISLIGPVLLYGTLNLQEMVHWQDTTVLHGWLPRWGIFFQPLAFLVFLTVGIAETKRIPFDLPEGESEIIGYFLEYSGMKFGAFFLADFIETVVVAMLTVTVFLGGWSVPYLSADQGGFVWPWGAHTAVPPAGVALLQMAAFWVKVFAVCWLLLLIRWTLPRFRIDQAVRLGWQYLLPLSVLNTFGTAAVLLIVGQ